MNKYIRGKWLILWVALLVLVIFGILVGVGLQYMKEQSFNEDPAYWENDIVKIEERYAGDYPQDVIVFTGSFSIRKWVTLADDMRPCVALNHGFGGSKIKDATYYLDRLVFPFSPKAVVLIAGTNDINGVDGSSKSGEQVLGGFVEFVETIRAKDKDLPIYYISISPTKARWSVWSDADEANKLIAAYAEDTVGVTFIDTTTELLDAEGMPNKAFYGWDGLHLNTDGYAVWTSIIKPIIETDIEL